MFLLGLVVSVASAVLFFVKKEKLTPSQAAMLEKVSEPVLGLISDSSSTVLQASSKQLVTVLQDLPQAATPGGQKIPVDEAAKQIQAQIEKLPSSIAERARYEYCKQVVVDYERENPQR